MYISALPKMGLQIYLTRDGFCQRAHDLAWPTDFKMNGYFQVEKSHGRGLEAAGIPKVELFLLHEIHPIHFSCISIIHPLYSLFLTFKKT